jgi:hypothetical protein
VLAEHGLCTTSGQADRAAERLGLLRRAQQHHQGWLEAHDEELRLQERAVAREDAWRRRVDQRAVALDPPGWLVAELGPVPTDPSERTAWRLAAAELDGYRRAYGLDHPGPAKHGGGRLARDGRAAVPATGLAGEQASGTGRQPERRSRGDLGRRPMAAAGQRHQIDPDWLLGAEPRRQAPGRRCDWQRVQAALERLSDHLDSDHRHRRHGRTDRLTTRDLGRQERHGR